MQSMKFRLKRKTRVLYFLNIEQILYSNTSHLDEQDALDCVLTAYF